MRDALARRGIPDRLLATLLLILALLMAPHMSNLSPAVLGFFYVTLSWRLLALRHPGILPGRWWLLALVAVAIVLVIVSTSLMDGRVAGTALLVVMLGMKLLELRARRDVHVTVFLGYFLILTQFLYDQSLTLALYLFLGVLALNTIQVGLNRVRFESRLQLRNSAVLVAAALPLTLVVFLLFPRLQHPLWGIHTPTAKTGISDEVTLGDIGQLSRSSATAFRVRFDDKAPTPPQRYWRGPVLWQTDGRRWTAGRQAVEITPPPSRPGSSLGYEITLEPTGEYWLFGLDIVTGAPPQTHLNSNLALVGSHRVNRRETYHLVSDPEVRTKTITRSEYRQGLQLPEQVSPRVRALVSSWQQQSDPAQPLQIVGAALNHFSTEPFVYTLSPGELRGDPVDAFLFESRRGFCEHYASSFAVLMRLAGIPTRLVLGYQGGQKNPHADHWVVRQSDAHAWAEVWLPEIGWWRVDPTAAVAPQRVEQPINNGLADDNGEVVFGLEESGLLSGLIRDAGWLADAVDLGWHRWVVGFSAERQRSLLDTLGLQHFRGMAMAAAMLLGATLAIVMVYLISRLPAPKLRDPLPAIWQRLRQKLQAAGLDAPAWQGPETLCAEAAEAFPEQAEQLSAIAHLYSQLRYGRHDSPEQQRALRNRVRRLRLKRT